MTSPYSVSHVVGYKQHLPTQVIKLPLQYPNSVGLLGTPNEQFHKKLSNSGNVIDLNNNSSINSVIDYISYDILNDLKTITLSPINSKSNHFNLPFQNICISLPHSIISFKCLSISLTKNDNNNNNNNYVVIDLIDESYLFITIKISLEDFIVRDSTKIKYSLNNFNNWGHISVPYSFELRSNPYLLKSLDEFNIIVSLKDGGLLHFKRSNILNDFEVYTFNEAISMLPLNLFSGLFGTKPNDSRREIVLEGISSNSIVDVININSSSIIVTLTVSKSIKLWSLKSHQLYSDPIYITEIHDLSSWLTSIPAKYLQTITTDNDNNNTLLLLTLYYTTNSNQEIESDKRSRFTFKSWKISDSDLSLNDTDAIIFQPELPNTLLETFGSKFQNILWFIQDYQTQIIHDTIKYHILWKSNTSSVLVTYTIGLNNGEVLSINWSNDGDYKIFQEFSPIHSNDYYSNMILNSGRYDSFIVSTSLNLVRNHLGLDSIEYNKDNSIRQIIDETFTNAKKNIQDDKFYWFQLASLCEEFKKLSEEALSLTLCKNSNSNSNSNDFLVLQVNGLGLFRPSHYYESFSFQADNKLVKILNQLSSLISIKTFTKIQKRIKNLSKITELEIEEFDGYIGNKLSDDEVHGLMTELESIPNVLDLINLLIDGSLEDFETIESFNNINSNQDSTNLSISKRLFTISTFKTIKLEHESILLKLLILFVICDSNNEILELLNKIISKLRSYDLIEFIFDTSFKSSDLVSPIEKSKLNSVEYSLFWSGVVGKEPKLKSLISNSTLNEACDYYFGNLFKLNSDEIIVNIVLDLLNRNEGKFIKDSFFKELKISRNIDRFLIGLIYLINNEVDEFFQIFKTYEAFDINNQALKDKIYNSLSQIENIKLFLDTIFTSETNEILKKSNYFHSLSELSKSQADVAKYQESKSIVSSKNKFSSTETNFITTAIEFEKISIDILKESNSFFNELNSHYINLFELALIISNYNECSKSLSNLSIDDQKYKELFTRYIIKLVSNQAISKLFPPEDNSLYIKNYLLIDEILISLANNEKSLSNSLKLYQYVYSWRLFGSSSSLKHNQVGDKRGAIEALYIYIVRFKRHELSSFSEDTKQFKLKVLELYMIIINSLKSFEEDDDKWIIKVGSKSNEIKTLDQLKIEYYEWSKELELELQANNF
ncbi:nuclear pore protein [Scheffersomyces amazonensis]|uniref:nuclear pore protein n=1 Tax=Scheffersomyces amazonensis TaxID=1078765 RepID=UPI00315CF16B